MVGQAQTGTGKTAAFLISIIAHQLEFPKDPLLPPGTPRALIVAPTRELAMQIADDAEGLCRFSGLRVLSVVGGMDFERQRRILEERRVDILVGTPGRLIDFITRGKLNLRQVEQLVLDEADRMLSMGFIPDVRRIVRQTPPKERRQTLLFSATFSETILRLASQWTLDAEQVVIEPESVATDRVEQRIYLVAEEDKFALLYNLMQDLELERVIVFANRRDSTRLIQTRLAALGVDCELLSGEVPQAKRLKTLERFKDGAPGCWPLRTWLGEASTWTASATSSTTISRKIRRITCTALAARAGPAPRGFPSASSANRMPSSCRKSRRSSG